MKKVLQKLGVGLLTAAMTVSCMTFTPAQAKTNEKYVTRATVLRQVEKILGASVQSADMSNVKDVAKTDSCYKTMAVAVQAGLVEPDAKTGKLYPNKKATRDYVAEVVSNVLGVEKEEILGTENANEKLTKKNLTAELNSQFPNVLKNSVSKVKKGNVVINKPGVTLKNVTVRGNLVIGDGVGNQESTLKNVSVKGNTVIRGGGTDSVILKGKTKLSTVIVCQKNHAVSLKVPDSAEVSTVYIQDGSKDVHIIGNVGTLVVDGEGICLNLAGASVSKLTVNDTAKNAAVLVDAKSSVAQVNLNAAGAKLTGDGKAGTVYVNANETEVTLTTEKIQVKDGVKAPTTGKDTKPTGGSTGGSGGGSAGGSTGGSASGSTEESKGNRMDQAFADGYPKVSVNADKQEVTVTYKLKEGIASAENPVEIYNMVESAYMVSGDDKKAVTAVLHGHAYNYDGTAIEADDYGYLKLTDDQEQTRVYSYAEYGYGRMVVYSVVRQGDEISSAPNAVTFEGKEYTAESAQRNPYMYSAVKNKAGDKVYLWFNEKLDKTSVPESSCFKIENFEAKSAGNVTSVQIDDTFIDKNMLESCVVLSVKDMASEGLIFVKYTPPTDESTGLKTAENVSVVASQSAWIRSAENVNVYGNVAYVSADGKYLTAMFKRPLMTFVSDDYTDGDAWDAVTVTVNGEAIQKDRMTLSVDANGLSLEMRDLNLENTSDVKVKLTIKGEDLKDLAGDRYENEQELTATVANDVEWKAVSYDKSDRTIKVKMKNSTVGGWIRGCGLEIKVDGKVYPVRGFLKYDSSYQSSSLDDTCWQYVITAKQLEHIDLVDAETIEIRGVARDEIPVFYTFTSAAGKPLGTTDWVNVTISE